MKILRACTRQILQRVEDTTERSIQFLRDDSLPLIATLQMARKGAPYHILRYKPTDEPLDYTIAFQACFVLRLFENEPAQRFDFLPEPDAGSRVLPLLRAGQSLGDEDKRMLPGFAQHVAQWALMNLRSLPIGMRVDQWIASEYPELAELQRSSIQLQQQQNVNLLAYKLGRLTIPTTLMGSVAAYALFADRLTGDGTYAIPYELAGILPQGEELLQVWDTVPGDAGHDCALVDQWAAASGLANWYSWTPYQP